MQNTIKNTYMYTQYMTGLIGVDHIYVVMKAKIQYYASLRM